MKLNITSKNAVFIEINDWTYYIDDSTNEQIMDKWVTDEPYSEDEYDPNSEAERENEYKAVEEYENNKTRKGQ